MEYEEDPVPKHNLHACISIIGTGDRVFFLVSTAMLATIVNNCFYFRLFQLKKLILRNFVCGNGDTMAIMLDHSSQFILYCQEISVFEHATPLLVKMPNGCVTCLKDSYVQIIAPILKPHWELRIMENVGSKMART